MTLRACAVAIALAASTAFGVCSAAAADLPVRPAPAPMAPVAYAPAAIYNWTGLYIGGQLGAGFGNSSWTDPFTGAKNNFNSGAGFLGGAQVGGNLQFNMLVVGVEGDFNWSSLKASGTNSIGNAINSNVNWTSTVTGRVGAAFDRLLVYGKGGVAFAQDQNGFTDLFGNSAERHLDAHRLDRGRRAGIRHNQKSVGQDRIRLSRLRFANAEFHDADHAALFHQRQSQRPGNQGRPEFPLWRPVSAEISARSRRTGMVLGEGLAPAIIDNSGPPVMIAAVARAAIRASIRLPVTGYVRVSRALPQVFQLWALRSKSSDLSCSSARMCS